MKQAAFKNLNKMDKNELNRFVTVNFLETVSQAIETRTFESTTEKEFAQLITTEQSKISKLKTDENRYVTLDILAKAVNVLGMDANSWFVADNNKKKKLVRDGVNITSNFTGNNNKVTNGKNNTVINGTHTGNIFTAEKIIQGMTEPEQTEMKKYLDSMAQEVNSLKKTIDHYKVELKLKDEKLLETQGKYISLLESLQNKKK